MSFSEELQNIKKANGFTVDTMIQLIKDNAGMDIPRRTFENWLYAERIPPNYMQIEILKALEKNIKN